MLESVKRWVLPVAAIASLVLAGLTVTLIDGVPGLMRSPETVTPASAAATVIRSVPCAEEGARDTVEIDSGGPIARYPLDACGNPEGFVLDVEIVTVDGESRARLAGTGGAEPAVVNDRIGAVLLVLAGLGGASLMLFTSRRRLPPAHAGHVTEPHAVHVTGPHAGQAASPYAEQPAVPYADHALDPYADHAAAPHTQPAVAPYADHGLAPDPAAPHTQPAAAAAAASPAPPASPTEHATAPHIAPPGHARWSRPTGTVRPPWTGESSDATAPVPPPRVGDPTGAWPVPN